MTEIEQLRAEVKELQRNWDRETIYRKRAEEEVEKEKSQRARLMTTNTKLKKSLDEAIGALYSVHKELENSCRCRDGQFCAIIGIWARLRSEFEQNFKKDIITGR